MATTKKNVRAKVKKKNVSTESEAPVKPRVAKTKGKQAIQQTQSSNRNLIIFGVLVGVVITFAVVGKLRQGPPIKILPARVEATYRVNEGLGLASPRGIAVDAAGSVYVADLQNNRVVKFKPEGSVDCIWGKIGTANGEFKEPSGIAVNSQGEVLVADAWNGRIQKFKPTGEYLGEISANVGRFYSPRNVAIDKQGFIYVADTGNSCVKKFGIEGNLVKKWGEFGIGHNRFQETFGIWIDQNNLVYVGDAGNRKIKIFDDQGKFQREQFVKGWKTGTNWPMVAVDSSGHIFAADAQNQMVWIYSKKGKYLGSWGNQPGKEIFTEPLGIAVNGQDAVYVCDMKKGQVLKLAPFQE